MSGYKIYLGKYYLSTGMEILIGEIPSLKLDINDLFSNWIGTSIIISAVDIIPGKESKSKVAGKNKMHENE